MVVHTQTPKLHIYLNLSLKKFLFLAFILILDFGAYDPQIKLFFNKVLNIYTPAKQHRQLEYRPLYLNLRKLMLYCKIRI